MANKQARDAMQRALKAPEGEAQKCPECGSMVKAGAEECPKCGADMTESPEGMAA